MTVGRNNSGGGGTLNCGLCNLPKGGGADDRTQRGSSLPVPGGRLPFQREQDTSVHELAWYQLGADSGTHDSGHQRNVSCGKHGRRSQCNTEASAVARYFGQHLCGCRSERPGRRRLGCLSAGVRRIFYTYGDAERPTEGRNALADWLGGQRLVICRLALWRRSSARKFAALPSSLHLAPDCIMLPIKRGYAV